MKLAFSIVDRPVAPVAAATWRTRGPPRDKARGPLRSLQRPVTPLLGTNATFKDAPVRLQDALKYACSRAARAHGWTDDEATLLVRELYRALVCKTLCWDDLSVSVPVRIDQCWHELILNTDDYDAVCQALGRKLRHTTRTEQDSDEAKRERVHTLAVVYQQVYGGEEPDPWCWMAVDEAHASGKRRRKSAAAAEKAALKDVVETRRMFVKTLTAKTIAVDFTPRMSVWTIKALISYLEGYPVDSFRLIRDGEQWCDDSLAMNKVPHEATVHLVMSMRGC